MEKFLNLIEENQPAADIDIKTEAKRSLQRYLGSKDIKSIAKVFRDEIMITLDDGRVVQLEIKGITKPKQEEQEADMGAMTTAVRAVASLPDQGLLKQIGSPTARKLAGAKRKLADAVDKLADNITRSITKVQ